MRSLKQRPGCPKCRGGRFKLLPNRDSKKSPLIAECCACGNEEAAGTKFFDREARWADKTTIWNEPCPKREPRRRLRRLRLELLKSVFVAHEGTP